MEYRQLGKSGLKISEIGLGSGSDTFAGGVDEAKSIRIIDHALESGINLIDTAATYAHGHSEELVGKAVKGKRAQVIIATKFGHPGHLAPHEQRGGSRNHILKSVEASLRRLNTDYIDLYYQHFPDPETPVAETLRTLDALVRAGKVRYIACANYASWQLCEALWTSRTHNLESFVATQPKYNIIERHVERELVPLCQAYGVGVVPFRPLAGGFLTGKYRRDQMPAAARLTKGRAAGTDILTEANFAKLVKLEAFAKERGHTIGELSIAWLLSHPWLSSVIAGATSTEQISLNVAAARWKLTAEDIAELDRIP